MSIKEVFGKIRDYIVLFWGKIQSLTRTLLISTYLFFLYSGVLVFTVVTLSSYQIQSELKGNDKTNNLYELRTLWILYESERKSRRHLKSNNFREQLKIDRQIRNLNRLNEINDNEEDREKNLEKINELEEKKEKLEAEKKQLDENAATVVIATYNQKAEKNEKVAEVFSLAALFPDLRLYYFLLLPVEVLTLFLTLSMGVLGSTIHINREFFHPSEKRFLFWYLYRPALGMATALAVFILFRAGQLSLSGSPGGTSSEGMNAFMVSFLAVISGLLSEDAYLWIVRVGQRFFKTAPKDKRYANPHAIRQQLTAKNITEADLANYVNVEPKELEGWLKVEKLVMQEYQFKVSELLERPIEDLFFN